MLKSQDIVLLLKFLANRDNLAWSQNKLALHLCMSVSEVNASIKRLRKAALLHKNFEEAYRKNRKLNEIDASLENNKNKLTLPYLLVISAAKEFLLYGVKYVFPAELGEYTRGVATGYAAPIFEDKIVLGNDPIPVWPHAEGDRRGFTLTPLYPSVPQSVIQYPDPEFYELLTLIDAMRQGRARERNIAIKLISEKLDKW